jgi:hypothetical protein
MKRSLLLIVLLGVAVSAGLSQPIRRYGAKLGASSATWNWEVGGSTVRGIDSRIGIDIGAYLEWLNTPVISVVSELSFVQKGMKEDIPVTTEQFPDGTGEFFRHNVRLDNISFAILPKGRLEIGALEVYGIAGARMDVSLSNSVVVVGREPMRTQFEQAYQYLVDRFKSYQLGGTFGIGAQLNGWLPFSTGLEFRYSPNFHHAYSTGYSSVTNRSFELMLTISK